MTLDIHNMEEQYPFEIQLKNQFELDGGRGGFYRPLISVKNTGTVRWDKTAQINRHFNLIQRFNIELSNDI